LVLPIPIVLFSKPIVLLTIPIVLFSKPIVLFWTIKLYSTKNNAHALGIKLH
jgi:hypothetical protein